MTLVQLDSVGSTQTELINGIDSGKYSKNTCIQANMQTAGYGRRGTEWLGVRGNLFFSFSLDSSYYNLVPNSAYAIYYAYIFKEILSNSGSKVYLKWPNDFYINEYKIGGILVNSFSNYIVVGVGLNLMSPDKKFGLLDILIDIDELLEVFLKNLEKKVSWSIIKEKYLVELGSLDYMINTLDNRLISIKDVELNDDGSLSFNNERIYSRI